MFFKDKRRIIQDLLGHTKEHLELGQVVHAPFHQQSHCDSSLHTSLEGNEYISLKNEHGTLHSTRRTRNGHIWG